MLRSSYIVARTQPIGLNVLEESTLTNRQTHGNRDSVRICLFQRKENLPLLR